MEISLNYTSTNFVRIKRFQFDRVMRSQFLRFLLENHELDAFTDIIDLEQIKDGIMPQGFDIHHLIPLFGGGSNDFENLVLMERPLHEFVHRHYYDVYEQLKNKMVIPALKVPEMGKVVVCQNFAHRVLKTVSRRAEKLALSMKTRHNVSEWIRIENMRRDFARLDVPVFWKCFKVMAGDMSYLQNCENPPLPPTYYESLLYKIWNFYDSMKPEYGRDDYRLIAA